MKHSNLLLEIGTEDLPSLAGHKLSINLAYHFQCYLKKKSVFCKEPILFSTINRIGFFIEEIESKERTVIHKGPLVHDTDNKAIINFLSRLNITQEQTSLVSDGKHFRIIYREILSPTELKLDLIQDSISHAITALNLDDYKLMAWDNSKSLFIRPVRWLCCLYNDQVLPIKAWNLEANRYSQSSNLNRHIISISQAQDYQITLLQQGKVIVQHTERRKKIESLIQKYEIDNNVKCLLDDNSLNVITSLVEDPTIIACSFDPIFLSMPSYVLEIVLPQIMSCHKKYIRLVSDNNELTNQFLIVTNQTYQDNTLIAKGYGNVVNARLRDVKFFYAQDTKNLLNLEALKKSIYLPHMGTLFDRVHRLSTYASLLSLYILGSNKDIAARAAFLSKTDLTTYMVKEYPALQGLIGRHYALLNNEDSLVAEAIAEHYKPRFSNDNIPVRKNSIVVGLADRLEYIMSLSIVHSDKIFQQLNNDPFAIRRNSLAILRMLREENITLTTFVDVGCEAYNQFFPPYPYKQSLLVFFQHRLEICYKEEGKYEIWCHIPSYFQSLSQVEIYLTTMLKYNAVYRSLHSLVKRLESFVQHKTYNNSNIDTSIFITESEHALYKSICCLSDTILQPNIVDLFEHIVSELPLIFTVLENFFSENLVLIDDDSLKNNRLALLDKCLSLLKFFIQ